jgi:hypothetical protein
LTEVITLADDATDSESMTVRIRFAANRALGLYEVSSDENAH